MARAKTFKRTDRRRSMKDIIITYKDVEGFTVKQGDKYSDKLSFDEMLGLVAALTMPKRRPTLQWMKTKEDWDKYMEQFKPR